MEEVTLELARTGVGYNISTLPDGTMTKVSMQRHVLITANLTEDTFATYLDQIESNTLVAREAIRLAIDNIKPLVQSAAQ